MQLRCTTCSADWPRVLGVPFIGEFEPADALGLIEIVANVPNRSRLRIEPELVNRIDQLSAGYHAASDKKAFCAVHQEAQASWFLARYNEWQALEGLLEGLNVSGTDVLDIGAGQGFDAYRLALRGARVTALEFSPILAEAGSQSFPGMRWIGGFAHALPFRNASFDYVFINAALHHMRDLPATIAEALRVLRPGGYLITSSDPFRADATGPALEFDVFDRHEAVLLGINEQIPPLSDFLDTIERNREVLAPELFTQVLYGGRSGSCPALEAWSVWDFDAHRQMLKARSGSIAMRVRLTAPWPHPRALQREGVLPPATFVEWLDDPTRATAYLARIIPRAMLDMPFPGVPGKLDLINGWRVAQCTATERIAYRRARLFRSRGVARTLRFELRSPVQAQITLLVNAVPTDTASVGATWTTLEADLSALARGEPFVIEFRREGEPSNFDTGCFEVRQPPAAFGARLRDTLRACVRRFLAAA